MNDTTRNAHIAERRSMSSLTSLQPIGETEVLVCFEYTPAEPEGKRGTTTDCPASPASVAVTGVMLNGEEIDHSFFAPAVVQKWENLIQLEMMQ
jgi:hypothetical protein